MENGSNFEQVARDVEDPNIDPSYLYHIASNYPALRPAVALNPSTYPELLEWLSKQPDPAIQAALAERYRRESQQGGYPSAIPADAAVSQQFAAARPQSQTPYDQGNSNKKLGILIAVMVLAALVIAVAVALFTGMFSATKTPSAAQKHTVATLETKSDQGTETQKQTNPSPEQQPTPAQLPIVAPAPNGALNEAQFSSPSGNIHCMIGGDSVYCAIGNREYLNDGPAACLGTFGLKIQGAGATQPTCDAPEAGQMSDSFPTLDYGQATTVGDFACISDPSGVNCWNIRTGHAFNMRRADYSVVDR